MSEDLFGSDDPEADFLAREQAALGNEAAIFGNDLSSGNPLSPNAVPIGSPSNNNATSPNKSNVLSPTKSLNEGMGGGFNGSPFDEPWGSSPTNNNASQPQSAVSAVPSQSSNSHGPPQVDEQKESQTAEAAFPPAEGSVQETAEEGESDACRQWRETFNRRVRERDEAAVAKHERTLDEAKKNLERFYAEYNDKRSKSIARNKEQESRAAIERESGDSVWERVAKHIEAAPAATSARPTGSAQTPSKRGVNFNPHSAKEKDGGAKEESKDSGPAKRDTTRMRQLLLNLKRDAKAPGTGVAA